MDYVHVDADELDPCTKDSMLTFMRTSSDDAPPSRLLKIAYKNQISPNLWDKELAYLVDYRSFYYNLKPIIQNDDKDAFVSFLRNHRHKVEKYPPWDVLEMACILDAVRCAAVLLEEFPIVDVNQSFELTTFPIHTAASYLSVNMIDFLMERGADVNILKDTYFSPVWFAVLNLREHGLLRSWRRIDPFSFTKLLHLLCSPQFKKPMHAIKVLAAATPTKDLEEFLSTAITMEYFVPVAALLIAAGDKLLDPSVDLKNTVVVKCIFKELQKLEEEIKTCESWDKDILERKKNKKKALVDAFSLVKIIWMASLVVEHCFFMNTESIPKGLEQYHMASEIFNDQAMFSQLPINVHNENIDRLLSKLKLEAEALSKLRTVSSSSASAGDRESPTLNYFSSRPQNTPLVKPLKDQLPKLMHVKPSSHIGSALNRLATPLLQLAKRYMK